MHSRANKLCLLSLNAVGPDRNIGGAATGSLDFSQPDAATFPTMDARLDIANFTRSGIAAVSTPVDVVFNGRLLPEGGDVRALFKRGSATIGRMVARLSPRSEEHTSELQSLMRISYAGCCLK